MSLTQLATSLLNKNLKLVTAESCTGGGVAYAITSVSGSSDWFERGFVTYSNESKQEILGVSAGTLERFGAVSEQTALEMAQGAIDNSHADVAVSVTGIAGPTGGSAEKPVGTVWFGFARKDRPLLALKQFFQGDRESIRKQAVEFALNELGRYVE